MQDLIKYLGTPLPSPDILKMLCQDLSGSLVIRNLSFNGADVCSIPGQGTDIPHALRKESKSVHTTTINLCISAGELTCSGAHTPQLERSQCPTMKDPHATINKQIFLKIPLWKPFGEFRTF